MASSTDDDDARAEVEALFAKLGITPAQHDSIRRGLTRQLDNMLEQEIRKLPFWDRVRVRMSGFRRGSRA